MKGLRVNYSKSKVMWCRADSVQSEDSGKHPCGVCRKGIGHNLIMLVTIQSNAVSVLGGS